MTKRAGAIVASVLVVMTAACGSSGGSKGASTKDSTTTTKPDPAADRTRAATLVLTAEDLPAGWVGSKHEKDSEDDAENQKISDCVGAFDPKFQTAEVNGDDFDMDTSEISSDVTVVDTRAHFLADVAALKGNKLLPCVESIFTEDLPKSLAKTDPGVKIANLKVSRLSSPTYGDVTVGFRVSLTVSGPGGTVPLFIDGYQYGAGRDEASVTFSGQGAPVDAELQQSILKTAAAKLGKSNA